MKKLINFILDIIDLTIDIFKLIEKFIKVFFKK